MICFKRLFLWLSAVFGLFLSTTAHPVDLEIARNVAAQFMGTDDVQLSATYFSDQNLAAFHVFNTGNGFVIVAADDGATPIIGYSHESCFDPNNVPIQLEDYLRAYAAMIRYNIDNHFVADKNLNGGKGSKAIGPLLTDQWHQGCFYNSLCPTFASAPCGHAEVGCVAVAMGQIMHYWNYPSTGWGSHSYNNLGATISADFGNTTYAWDQMPDILTEDSSSAAVEAVATLLFQCGVSVDMKYAASGSLANPSDIPDALRRYFNYSKQLRMEKKADYDDETWGSMLKQCLDQQRPILYSGYGSAGHAFVCDGYDSDGLFHFNWGWGGNANGYFSLGNLNPNGHDFNANNYAILDILPQYEPCLVNATIFPANAGTVEGTGEYHYGAQCTLNATPSEGFDFYCWTRDGQVLSNAPTITLEVLDDIPNIKANFSCFTVSQITANYDPDENDPSSPNVSLSWTHPDTDWVLLKQFGIPFGTGGIASDGERLYITYETWSDPLFSIEQYTMDGALVESFNVDSLPDAFCLAYDGTDYYCNGFYTGNLSVLFRIDMDKKKVIESTDMGTWFGALSYDPEYDGFWISSDFHSSLYNRQGHKLKTSPPTSDYIQGSTYLTDQEGNPHLLLLMEHGILDYNINNNIIQDRPLVEFEGDHTIGYGACRTTYQGKDAMVFSMDNTICIYEIKGTIAQMSQIVNYRIYRSDSEGNVVMVADGIDGSSYIDTSWNTIVNGLYRYGISSVYADGSESEIVWSGPIAKTNYGVGEIDEPQAPTVQKIIEDGHLFILVNGKKYSVTGQEIR